MEETKSPHISSIAVLDEVKKIIPKHVGIIMDGNRRWAKQKGKNSKFGHLAGYKRLKEISKYCKEVGVKILTVYALSSDNLKERDDKELDGIFDILKRGLKKEIKRALKENIRINIIGRRKGLPDDLVRDIEDAQRKTKNNTAGIFNIALNYGGRTEIIDAIREIVRKGVGSNDINENLISENLYTSGQEEPELIIRTGGHQRTSNFLPWQATYSEYYFTNILWPDFSIKEFNNALNFYQSVQRNFGA